MLPFCYLLPGWTEAVLAVEGGNFQFDFALPRAVVGDPLPCDFDDDACSRFTRVPADSLTLGLLIEAVSTISVGIAWLLGTLGGAQTWHKQNHLRSRWLR